MLCGIVHANFLHHQQGFGHGNNAHGVGGTGFVAFRWWQKHCLVVGHDGHRTAAHQVGFAVFKNVRIPQQGAATKWGVNFVSGKGQKINVAGIALGAHVDAAVGC